MSTGVFGQAEWSPCRPSSFRTKNVIKVTTFVIVPFVIVTNLVGLDPFLAALDDDGAVGDVVGP